MVLQVTAGLPRDTAWRVHLRPETSPEAAKRVLQDGNWTWIQLCTMRELNINNGACFMKKWFQILEHEIALPIIILHALGAFKICSWTNIHHLDTRYGCISISVIERVWKGQGTLCDLSFTKADIYMIRPLHGMMTDDCGFGTCSNCRTSEWFPTMSYLHALRWVE